MGRPRTVSDEQILDATLAVLGELGTTGLTLAAVGRRCGIRAPSISERFGSKRQLLLQAVSRGAEAGLAQLAGASEGSDTACSAIVAALDDLAAGVGGRREAAAMLSLLQLDVEDDELGAIAARYMAEARNLLRRLLERAQIDGELLPGDADLRAVALQSAFHGSMLVWAVDRGADSVAARARRVVEHLLTEWATFPGERATAGPL
jgi:AcrR family transcriptional regulator